jgi:hypothetical protein
MTRPGRVGRQKFRQTMVTSSARRRIAYNEGLAQLPALIRTVLAVLLILAVVAAFIVLGAGIHHLLAVRR